SEPATVSSVFEHRPVMLEPTLAGLIDPGFEGRRYRHGTSPTAGERLDGVWVDGTFGRGGHSRALLEHLAPDAKLVVFDRDPLAIVTARQLVATDPCVTVVHAPFADMQQELELLGCTQVRGILLDVGVSSPQIDDADRGFSFMKDGPLDMRMDT